MTLGASIWWDDAPRSLTARFEEAASTRGHAHCEFLVVGAGIAGVSLARELARRGREVVVVDREHPGAGATSRNAGFLLAESDCFGLAAARYGASTAQFLRDAGLRTRGIVRDVAGARGNQLGLLFPGSVRLASDVREAAGFEASTQTVDALQTVEPTRVRERGVALARPLVGALLDPGDGMVHPLRLLAALCHDARSHGAAFRRLAVTSLRATRGAVVAIGDTATIRAKHVVLATNAATRRLLRPATRLRPVRAQALAAETTRPHGFRRPVYASHGGDYWRPLGGRRLLLGGLRRLQRRRENTTSTLPSSALQAKLDDLLQELVGHDTALRVTHRWAGTMGFTPDGLPWIGPSRSARRIAVFAGWNGHGLGWAPGFAVTLAEHLADGDTIDPSVAARRAC